MLFVRCVHLFLLFSLSHALGIHLCSLSVWLLMHSALRITFDENEIETLFVGVYCYFTWIARTFVLTFFFYFYVYLYSLCRDGINTLCIHCTHRHAILPTNNINDEMLWSGCVSLKPIHQHSVQSANTKLRTFVFRSIQTKLFFFRYFFFVSFFFSSVFVFLCVSLLCLVRRNSVAFFALSFRNFAYKCIRCLHTHEPIFHNNNEFCVLWKTLNFFSSIINGSTTFFLLKNNFLCSKSNGN